MILQIGLMELEYVKILIDKMQRASESDCIALPRGFDIALESYSLRS